MDISQIYAHFQADADQLYRRAMLLSTRSRVVRVHHLLHAALDLAVNRSAGAEPTLPADQRRGTSDERVVGFLEPFRAQLARHFEQDPTGCLDTPMTNSPAVRQVLQLSYDRREGDAIRPSQLVTMGACSWEDETPPGPRGDAYWRQVSQFACSLGIMPPPGCDLTRGRDEDDQAGSLFFTDAEPELPRAPATQELLELIGPTVTEVDLARLAGEFQREQDLRKRAWFAYKLAYLRDHD